MYGKYVCTMVSREKDAFVHYKKYRDVEKERAVCVEVPIQLAQSQRNFCLWRSNRRCDQKLELKQSKMSSLGRRSRKSVTKAALRSLASDLRALAINSAKLLARLFRRPSQSQQPIIIHDPPPFQLKAHDDDDDDEDDDDQPPTINDASTADNTSDGDGDGTSTHTITHTIVTSGSCSMYLDDEDQILNY